ncbi:MAG: DUF3460 family protein [Leptothrix sp. (in: b-proteobacteria)]
MPFFWKPYLSEATEFIDSLKKNDPKLEERQRQGRALLWDLEQDRSAQANFNEARVPQQPYVYKTNG